MGRSKNFRQIKAYTYYIRRRKDGLQYYGVRFQNITLKRKASDDFKKHYWSSGVLADEFKKHPRRFHARIHYVFDSPEEAVAYERRLIDKILLRENWANAANYPRVPITDEVREKLSEGKRGEKNPMYGKSGELSPNFGQEVPLKTRRAVAKANRNREWTQEQREHFSRTRSGKNNAMYGRRRPDSLKKKLSELWRGANNKNFIGHYIYDGNKYDSSDALSRLVNVSRVSVTRWCQNPDWVITDDVVGGLRQHGLEFLDYADVGRTFSDIGFDFLPKGKRTRTVSTGVADISKCRNKYFYIIDSRVYTGVARLKAENGIKRDIQKQVARGNLESLKEDYGLEVVKTPDYPQWKACLDKSRSE